MNTLLAPPIIHSNEAYARAKVRPNVNTPMKRLSAVELATVRIVLQPVAGIEPSRDDLCSVLASWLHYWQANGLGNQVRHIHRGWRCAEQMALIMATGRSLNVWRGWDALRMLDARDDLGVEVWVQADTSLSAMRLRERLAEIAATDKRR